MHEDALATIREQVHRMVGSDAAHAKSRHRLWPGLSRQSLAASTGLGMIVLLGAFLRFYGLGAHGIGNSYYAAAVDSMLKSWHNFFFASFEPGGSVTVDKPPLDLWAQVASARVLGLDGFALALPQALAGVLAILLTYGLVKRQFGVGPGLIAALVLAVMPVTVATDRYNTMDGLLVFVLLLAAWAFWWAVRSGRLRHLLLGAFLVGVAFNVKMLEAFLPLPGFYALYLFGAHHPWRKRIAHLAAASAVLLVVSLSWAMAVDLTPPQDRPYVGSSTDNSVMELIVGHNGLARVIPMGRFGGFALFGGGGQPDQVQADRASRAGGADGANSGPGFPQSLLGDFLGGATVRGGFGGFGSGQPGLLRLVSEPLATQSSWLLPLALLAIPLLLALVGRRWWLSGRRQALLLWGGWLLPALVYFSFTQGMFHSYYLITLGPPVAALVGAGAWGLGQLLRERRWLGRMVAALFTGITLAFQVVTLRQYPEYAHWIIPSAVAVWVVGVALMLWRPRPWIGQPALALAVLSLAIAPAVWSGVTALNAAPGDTMGHAGPQPTAFGRQFRGMGFSSDETLPQVPQNVLDYLLAHSDPNGYLVATDTATEAAPYVLATGRPVLTFGGFMGTDNVVDAQQLQQMVDAGKLRYVLADPQLARQKPDIAQWLTSHARPVALPEGFRARSAATQGFRTGGFGGGTILYDCRPS